MRERVKEDRIDAALADTFPASDPPFFMAETALTGGKQPAKKDLEPKERTEPAPVR